ncbi:MAG: sigma-70 family RNA polymerase sigma factor [Bacillota bacterium]|jgi:RNA polymerase sigma-70 factor (ECF subfamily)
MSIKDNELLKKSQQGDVEAFEELISAYQQRIYNTAYRLMANPHDAADMAQEAMIKIYKALPKFRGEASLSTWIYRITVNTCRDELAKKYRNLEKSLDEEIITEYGEMACEVADYSNLPDEIVANVELGEYLQKLIDSLQPKYRLVIILREQMFYSYQEIADALGISIGTVKSRINRARASLQRKITSDVEHNPQILSLISQRGERA